MNLFKVVLAAAAAGTIVLAFRDGTRGTWLRPALPRPEGDTDDGAGRGGRARHVRDDLLEQEFAPGDEEPVLGYDGMDRDTLMEWLRDSDLDTGTLRQIRLYEATHLDRDVVLDTIDELIG